ncbi:MAG: phenylalanine--tRNA ligase subunit beta [Candidatus Sungbacteria bacterium]|nr:phenylalanine--tRNA ligase subunit beta [Candidatus Sungbacteria bacterium]
MFDYDKLKAIIVRRAKKGEKIAALDGKTYELNPEILVISDEVEAIAIAGIKGGAHSGVSEKTKTIVLESANFEQTRIRKASKLLNLKTDASYRFEHGLDPNLTETAINRLAELIIEVAGGEVASENIDEYPEKIVPRHLALRLEYVNRLAGTSFPPVMLEAALKRLGYNYQKQRTGEYHVETPTIRQDLEREEDLIEEVIRIWGYEKISAVTPAVTMYAAKEHEGHFWERRIKNFLVGIGFTEVFRYVFTGEQEIRTFDLDTRSLIEIVNPLAPEYRFLTNTPLASFISAAKENEAHFPAIRMFGITKSFSKGKNGLVKGVEEKKHLVLVWSERTEGSEEIFFRLKGAADELFESLGLAEYWYDAQTESAIRKKEFGMFHPYRVAEIKVDGEKIGVVGELHPAIRKILKIKNVVATAEIDAEKLIAHAKTEAEYIPVSRFPAVIRDVALIVPEEEKTETVASIIENTGGELLTDADLFDYFQDEEMRGVRKKSLAFHLTFQSKDRTLTDKEVAVLVKKIVSSLEEKGWTVRK